LALGGIGQRETLGENSVVENTHKAVNDSDVLVYAFSDTGGSNRAGISGGDSGDGVFIQDRGTWKLAGTLWAGAGPYNTSTNGQGFYAALFDTGGIFATNSFRWEFDRETMSRQPQTFFSTRISSYLDWFRRLLAQSGDTPILLAAERVDGAFSAETAAIVDVVSQTIRFAPSARSRFYRMEDTVQRQIVSIAASGAEWVITYR
jgi:hypothetical protein